LTIVKSILTNFEPILIILYFVKLLEPYREERVKREQEVCIVKLDVKFVKLLER